MIDHNTREREREIDPKARNPVASFFEPSEYPNSSK
jgi:hypothetical protein